MSKFKSFAQQGSFRDYQIQAPDETGKIKEETARTIRGKERAQASLERQNNLYLQAQKLAQGVEENQREQNFKLETENRQAFKDALTRDYQIQSQNDKIAAAKSAETFKQLSVLSKSAFELYGQYQEMDLKRNQQENARLAYAAGADYKTLVGIQTLGDNLTKAEFAQTEFMRQKLAEGGNVDALFALYERRASKGFINNIAVAQNTAHGYGIAAQQEILDFQQRYAAENDGRMPTIEEQKINLKTFESEYFANITGADGRGLNANLMTTYVAPTMRRIQTGFESQFEKQQNAERQSIVKQNFLKGLDHAWNTGGAAGVYKYLTEKGIANKANFEMYAEWRTNKSLDFGSTGLDSRDMEALDTFVFPDSNGNDTTYIKSRGMLSDGAQSMQAKNTRIRAEKQLTREAAADNERKAQSASIELYNERAADGSISQADLELSREQDRQSGIPNFESEGTKQMAKELDSVRYEAGYDSYFTDLYNKNLLNLSHLELKGVSAKLKNKWFPLIEKQHLIKQTDEYKEAVKTITKKVTDGHPQLVAGRKGSNRDHYSTNIVLNEQLRAFENDVLKSGKVSEISQITSGRLLIIDNKQKKPGAINAAGHYTDAIAETASEAQQYQEALQEDKNFIERSLAPKFRKDPAYAVNAYGENYFYEDYYALKRGEVTGRLSRRSAQMGVAPLVAMNFMAPGLSQQPITMDEQMQIIADKITPVVGRLVNNYRDSGSHLSRMNRADNIMDGTVAVAPVRGEAVNPTPRQAYDYMRTLGVSDIHAKGILANIEGESRFKTAEDTGDGGMSAGLFQMYDNRKRAMIQAVPDWKTNWRGQIQFALQDDRAPEYLQMNFNSAEEAADWFLENYERPAMKHRPERRKLNRAFIPQLGF